MSMRNWLCYVRSAIAPRKGPRVMRRRDVQRSTSYRLRVEPLEDRRMLSFVPAANYSAGTYPTAIATADFNIDGTLDLATTVGIASNSRVSVRLGDGAGGFGAAQDFATPGYDTPSSIFIADLNNDTRPDMVMSEFNSFSTLIGNGDGTFQPAVSTFGGSMVAIGHFDNVGYIDGIVTWIDGDWANHVQVYNGDGQGGFAPGPDASYWGWGGMTAVDLNNDGQLDVATGEGLAFLNFYGVLQFNWGQQAPLSGGAVAAGDFNGDANADLIVAADSVTVLPGNGDGTFQTPITHTANGARHSAVVTADFNADGRLDAVVTDSDAATVSAMLGNGDGTLLFGGAFAVGASPSAVTVGDFNGDGRPDLAVANRESNNITVMLNDGEWNTLPPARPVIAISDATVTEGNAGEMVATFTVSLSAISTETITVAYATGNGTATSGSDYQAASGNLTIPAGQTTGTITVPVNGDATPEPNETFYLNLTSVDGATIADGQGVGTIINDDVALSSLTIGDVSKKEGKGGTTAFSFTVTLSASSNVPVTVQYMTADGTATFAGEDYTAKVGTLTFQPGQTSQTITISVKGDKTKEADETFFVNLFGVTNAQIADGQGTGTILNDDTGSTGGKRTVSAAAAYDRAITELMFTTFRKRTRQPRLTNSEKVGRNGT
jgi:hypothetical protein